ncbi:MAG TPA: hypothetical protein VFC23_12855 [Thermoanaerobaculia bacterium]|nr:hypothetical protein [Thermoanaerobaculia bacterium]
MSEESTSGPPPPAAPPRAASPWLYAGPLLLLLVLIFLPLVRGTETLILRDVLNAHLPMKWSQAEALRHGTFPILDPYRAGGQPLAGNLNAAPFYPDNVLFLLGSVFWAFNVHFWLHLMLAPFAFYWLARSWGLEREPAWAAAACYTVSGFFLSHLNFYNLVAGAALAPALVAACLDLVRHPRRRGLLAPVVALLWTLLVLGGDPLMGILAFLLAVSGVALTWRQRPAATTGPGSGGAVLALLAAAFAAGTLIALPQIVELLRILPISYRGYQGYDEKIATVSSLDPRQTAEWLLPFLFGRPDVIDRGAFWGLQFYTGFPPFYFSLYPGLLTFALIAAAGRPRGRAAVWAWGWIGFGIFFSLGRFNPVAQWLLGWQKSLRYPIKFWLPVAVGASLLCGIGFDRLRAASAAGAADGARRRARWVLLLMTAAFAAFWIFLSAAPRPAERWMNLFVPRPAAFIANERLRWAGLAFLTLLLLLAFGLALGISRRWWRLGGPLLLLLHAGSQLWLLRPLYPMDSVVPYLNPPPALRWVPPSVLVVNPDYNYLFGPSQLRQGKFPEPTLRWVERRSFYELFPFAGPLWNLRYELNTAPEGLDAFLSRRAQVAVKGAKTNEERFRLLAAWGIGRVLVDHPLEPPSARSRLLATVPSFGGELYVYEVLDRAPEVFLARRVFHQRDLPAAFRRLASPELDPRRDAVLIDQGGRLEETGGGTARFLRVAPEEIEVEADAGPAGALLVLQRANLLFLADLDGRPVQVRTANAHHIGVRIPAGRHRVRFWIDRRPLHRALWGAAAGLIGVVGLAWWRPRNRRPDGDQTSPGSPASGLSQ